MTDFTLRPLTVPERKYTYAQSSQLQGQTGNIGYLRGDFGSSGDQFYTTWFDTRPQWKSDEFKRDLDDVINALRSEEYGLLQSRSQMVRYGRENKESEMQGAYTTEFGFRADTEKYAFVLRCNPTRGDYNFYCLCYVKEWLDKHIEEANRDIRFIDSHYKELFRIPDGERIIVTDRDGKTESYPCRYIDNYHTEVGRNLFHICEFAERMEQGGCTYAPMEPPLPPMCYSILPSTGEVIQIDRWQKGYTATSFNDGNRAENEAIKDKFNEKLGVSKAQEQAMLAGSMIRWDSIAAKPKSYDENGKAIKPKDYERYGGVRRWHENTTSFRSCITEPAKRSLQAPQAGRHFCALPATTTVCVLMSNFWFTLSDRTPPPFFRSTTGTRSSGVGSTVEHTALPSLRMPTNAASGLSTTSIFPTRIPAAFPAEFPFGKCGTNTRQK